jgi:hypothetical protein
LFGWLVADGWCWFVLREEYCWPVAGGWFVLREKYCWLVADKPSEQGERIADHAIQFMSYKLQLLSLHTQEEPELGARTLFSSGPVVCQFG